MNENDLQYFRLRHDERDRDTWLFVPDSCCDPLTVVVAFHGAGSCATQMAQFCGLNQTAAKYGFVVAYPNGSGRSPQAGTWNGGPQCGYAARHNVDDVGFTRCLLNHLQQDMFTTPIQAFATGMSNGGLFCYRLAEELADQFAAVAPVAGSMGKWECQPSRPVSILSFHGTADQLVPYEGGIGKKSSTRTPFIPVARSIENWVRANGCRTTPERTTLPTVQEDGTRVEREVYRGGREGSRVEHYRIIGGGHTWPGQPCEFDFLGATTANVDANQLIWEFFQSIPKRPDSHRWDDRRCL